MLDRLRQAGGYTLILSEDALAFQGLLVPYQEGGPHDLTAAVLQELQLAEKDGQDTEA